MVDVILLSSKIARTLRKEGFWAMLSKSVANLQRSRWPETDAFDRKYGTDTGGIEPLWKFNIQSPNARFGTRYEATQEFELEHALTVLCEDLKAFTFIDLGCGKGRALMIASRLGFGNLIGVEFVVELAEIARDNLEKLNIGNAVVLHTDAAEFRFPDCDTVVYLYNPFSQEVFRQVLSNMQSSFSKKLYVIYKTPHYAEMFDSSGFLKRFNSPQAAPHMHIWTRTP